MPVISYQLPLLDRDDLVPQEMGGEKARSFTEMAAAGKDEEVWFSFVIYKDKAHRDAVNAEMIKEMSRQMEEKKDMSVPFDMKRMAYGGFQVEVEG